MVWEVFDEKNTKEDPKVEWAQSKPIQVDDCQLFNDKISSSEFEVTVVFFKGDNCHVCRNL